MDAIVGISRRDRNFITLSDVFSRLYFVIVELKKKISQNSGSDIARQELKSSSYEFIYSLHLSYLQKKDRKLFCKISVICNYQRSL